MEALDLALLDVAAFTGMNELFIPRRLATTRRSIGMCRRKQAPSSGNQKN